jgi:hypothetical protein
MRIYLKMGVSRVVLPMIAGFLLATFGPAPAQAFPGAVQGQDGPPAVAEQMPSGKVVETMDSGGYTYLCLERDGAKIWAAVPKTEVKVGQQVVLRGGMVMQNFTSKTLNRTFDSILFASGLAQ